MGVRFSHPLLLKFYNFKTVNWKTGSLYTGWEEVKNFDPKPDLDNANVGMISLMYGKWHIHFPIFLFTETAGGCLGRFRGYAGCLLIWKTNIAGHRVNQRFTKGCTTTGVFFREPLFVLAMSQSPGLPGTLVNAYNPGMCLLALPVIYFPGSTLYSSGE